MQIEQALHDFIDETQREVPPARDPADLAAYVERYAAISRRLPSVLVPVTSGDFKLKVGGKPLPARVHWPTGAQQPVMMAWFPGGQWLAGTLETHDGLCRQLAHDLGIAVVCVQLAPASEGPLLQTCESAVLALRTLLEGRTKLGVQPHRMLVGGDGQRRTHGHAGRLAPGAGTARQRGDGAFTVPAGQTRLQRSRIPLSCAPACARQPTTPPSG
jgi:acetyl esterase/lipase